MASCWIGTCRLVGSNDQLPLLAALHAYHHHHSPMFLSIVSAQLKTFFVPKEDFTLKVTYLQGFFFVPKFEQARGERIVFWGPNTNTNIIRVPKNDRIRIRILFGFPKLTEYEYEYYSGFQKWPNTNTNIIRLPKNDQIRIRILFGFPKMTEYEYEYYWTL